MSKTAKQIYQTVQERGIATVAFSKQWFSVGRVKPNEEAGVVEFQNTSEELKKELQEAGLELHPFPETEEYYLVC